MHWGVLYVLAIFIAIVWPIWFLDAAWFTALSTFSGALVSLYAAFMLKDTLREQTRASDNIELQLRKDRAYMVFDGVDFETYETSNGQRKVKATATWLNYGNSPALNVRTLCRYVKSNYPEDHIDELKNLLTRKAVTVGQKRKRKAEIIIDGAKNPDAPKELIFLYCACLYKDIYNKTYLVENTFLVDLDNAFERMIKSRSSYLKVRPSPIGPRNGERKLKKKEIKSQKMNLGWVDIAQSENDLLTLLKMLNELGHANANALQDSNQ